MPATGTFDGCRGDRLLQAVLVLHPHAFEFAPVLWFIKFQCSLLWWHAGPKRATEQSRRLLPAQPAASHGMHSAAPAQLGSDCVLGHSHILPV